MTLSYSRSFLFLRTLTTALLVNPSKHAIISSWIVDKPEFVAQRIDKHIYEREGGSSTGAKNLIRRGLVLINDKPVSTPATTLQLGDEIKLIAKDYQSSTANYRATSFNAPKIEVIYEDDHLAVVIKPQGVLTYRSSDVSSAPVLTSLIYSALKHPPKIDLARQVFPLLRPRPVHRIDKDTGGIMLAAKTRLAQVNLGNQFAERKIKKTYHAITQGLISTDQGTIDVPLDGKESITEYQVISRLSQTDFGPISLVRLNPLTGRTHQIRRYLSAINTSLNFMPPFLFVGI